MKKILIVDDQPTSTEPIAIGLRKYGYYAESANNGKEGLLKIKNGKFDYVLCDIDMPEMNGWEFASNVSLVYSDINFIFMTAGLRGKVKEGFKKFPFLIKPFDFEKLVELLKREEV
ncbi:MAG: response regulator [Candidatus Marinimicrobia bacterium]|nr:response regulator [Candidatus Neomarinimicrobiota bacterium]